MAPTSLCGDDKTETWNAHRDLPQGTDPKGATTKDRMARKLLTQKGRCTYWKRKQIIEPVFGQIKSVRNFTRFSFRRIHKVIREWNLICLTHNLLKLYRLSLAT